MNTLNWKTWSYANIGRTFIIDESIPGDSNILKAVLEISEPKGLVKDLQETPLDYKHRVCRAKEEIADKILISLKLTSMFDKDDVCGLKVGHY